MTHPKICVIVLVCLVVSVANQLPSAQGQVWRSYAEIEGRAGGLREQGLANLFVPLWQDNSSMLFLDVRGYQDDHSAEEGNWGMAYRTVLPSEWIFGVNGFFDLRRAENNHTVSQIGFGLELLDVNRGFRFNAYIPEGDVESVDGDSDAFLDGGNIMIQSGFMEASYWGFDFEAERLMWFSDGGASSVDLELWASAGVFHFDNDGTGFDAITGPRLRTELRVFDVPLLGRDSRLVFAGQYQHDDVRGSQGTGIVSVRIPFGPGGGRTGRRLRGLARRMVAPIERDIDIVTHSQFEATEIANDALTGQSLAGVTVVDANTADVAAAVAGAGNIVILDGSQGTINTNASIVTQNNQSLLGGGLQIVGPTSGATAIFGSRPTISNSNNSVDTVVVASNVIVRDLDIVGGRFGVATTNNGTDDLSATSQILSNNVSNAANEGFSFSDVDGTVANNTATSNGGAGFFLQDLNAGGTFTGNIASNNGNDGFAVLNEVLGTFTNNTSTGNGGSGFSLRSLFGNVANNTATGNGNDGFAFDQVKTGGAFTSNIANNNGNRGYSGANNGGTVNNNTGTGNTNGGNTLP